MATFNDLKPLMILSLINESKSLPNSKSSMLRLTARMRFPLPLLDPVRLEPLPLLPLPLPFPPPPPPSTKPLRLSWLPLTASGTTLAGVAPPTTPTPRWLPKLSAATAPPPVPLLWLPPLPVLLLLPPDPPPLLLSVAAR